MKSQNFKMNKIHKQVTRISFHIQRKYQIFIYVILRPQNISAVAASSEHSTVMNLHIALNVEKFFTS